MEIKLQNLFQPVDQGLERQHFADGEQHPWHIAGAIAGVVAQGVDLTRCAKDDFLVGDQPREADAVNPNVGIGGAASGPRQLLGFLHSGRVEGLAKFCQELGSLDCSAAGGIGFLVVV